MLEEKYKEYTVLEEQRLLKELLGVQTEEEVYEIIKDDMLKFDEYVESHTKEFLENQSAAYLAYNSTFNGFMSDYKKNLEQLAELKRQELELLNFSDYASQNNNALSGIVNSNVGATLAGKGIETYVMRNGEKIKAYNLNGHTLDEYGNSFDFEEGDIIHTPEDGDYVWKKQDDGSYKGVKDPGSNSSESPKSSKRPTEDEIMKYAEEYDVDLVIAKIMAEQGYGHKYSAGIMGGPVTYTGLAMLHGSSSRPEYVLNSDQAYNLLRYMATTKPSFTTNSNDSGTQYILNGDIVLNEVDNAAEFWNQVTMAMDRRISVTKNSK